MDDFWAFVIVCAVAFTVGCIVGVAVGKPELAIKQRACWGDIARFNGDTLKVLQAYPDCLPVIYPARPK